MKKDILVVVLVLVVSMIIWIVVGGMILDKVNETTRDEIKEVSKNDEIKEVSKNDEIKEVSKNDEIKEVSKNDNDEIKEAADYIEQNSDNGARYLCRIIVDGKTTDGLGQECQEAIKILNNNFLIYDFLHLNDTDGYKNYAGYNSDGELLTIAVAEDKRTLAYAFDVNNSVAITLLGD